MFCCTLHRVKGDARAALLKATYLTKVKYSAGAPFSIDSVRAHDFLTNSQPKRSVDPKWYRANLDFLSYYCFYSSIGHIEGIYETDRLRILYQQMRYLEQTHDPDASSYQNAWGVLTTLVPPMTTTQPPQTPTTPAPIPDPLSSAQRIYLCDPKDPLCKPQIVYLPIGAVPVLRDPWFNHTCCPTTEEEIKASAPPKPLAPPPAPKKSASPPAITIKGMEYDCDPYWDPDCLIDHPSQPILVTADEVSPEEIEAKEGVVKAEESAPPAPAPEKTMHPLFDTYDFKRDLYDPFAYAIPAPEQE